MPSYGLLRCDFIFGVYFYRYVMWEFYLENIFKILFYALNLICFSRAAMKSSRLRGPSLPSKSNTKGVNSRVFGYVIELLCLGSLRNILRTVDAGPVRCKYH